MSKGNVDKFLELMQTDEGLARKMAACLYMLENGGGKAEGSGGFIAREIAPLAKEYGFEFTEQDFLDYTNEATAKAGLTAEDLAEVSGGKGGVRAALMGTLALLGVAAAPAAMEMVPGGEASPFSMVASAAVPATQEQQDEMKLYEAILQALQQPLNVNKQLEQKVTLENKRQSALRDVQKMRSGHLVFDAGKLSDAKQVIDEIYNSGVSCQTLGSLKTIEKFEPQISQLSETVINTTALKNQLEELKGQLKTILASQRGAAKNGARETFDKKALSLETSINKAKDILARAEELNKNKEQLVKNLQNIQSLVGYIEGKKIEEQIAALNEEIKDFSPENIAKKEADFNAINAFTNAIIEVNDLHKEVDDLLKTKGANQNILNDIKGALDIAARDLTKENAEEVSETLGTIKKMLDAEKENIKKIKSESIEKKEQQKKEQEEKKKQAAEDRKMAETVNFFKTTKENAKNTLPKLKDRLDGLENFVVKVQKRTDAASVQEAINRLRARIDSFGDIKYENANEKATELENIKKEFDSLMDVVYGFEENLFAHVKEHKKNIGEMLTFYKNEAKKAKDQTAVKQLEKLEQELAAISEKPTSQKELIESAAKLKNIKESIPQIKATLDKATTLKNIAEKVDANFAKVFDKIIKEIEAADSVDKINLAKEKLSANEQVLVEIMKEKINEANKKARILHEIAKTIGFDKLADNLLDLSDPIKGFNSDAAITEIYNLYQEAALFNAAEKDLTEWLGKQIDSLVAQANELKKQANGVDNKLYDDFNTMATNLADDKDELLKNLTQAAQRITNFRTNLAKYQDDLKPKLALKNQIDTLKEQITKLKDMNLHETFTRVANDNYIRGLENINFDNSLKQISDVVVAVKGNVDIWAKKLAPELRLKLSEEINNLLKNKAMGAEIQDELKAIKAALPKRDKADAASVVKAIDDVMAVKTKMANKLLEWHKILSEYHNTEEGIENIEDAIAFKLASMKATVKKMIAGTDGIKLDAETLNDATKLAQEIAANFNINDAAKGIKAEIDELLKNKVIDNDAKAKLNKIKNTLRRRVNETKLLTAIANIHDIKIGIANELLEWHGVLSECNKKGYHKEGKEQDVRIGLNKLSRQASTMLDDNQEGYQLSATNLATATTLAVEIADNLHMNIADVIDVIDVIDNVEGYEGFRTTGFRLLGGIRVGDYTAAWQANTLVTFLRDSVFDVSYLKFVDKETRAKLAKDIKHIFDQIKIDRETGKYYLPRFYNQLGAVNQEDLKLICEAYDVIAEDFGERVSYTPFVEGTTETTSGWSFSSMLSSITGAKKQNQLINKANHLINELKKVSRLDLLDVSPESRVALKKDILEIASQMQSRAHSWRFNKSYYYFSDIDDSLTKNMQEGLAKILEFYNSIQTQMKFKK